MAKEWKKSDEKFLSKHYQTMTNAELADKLGVTQKSVERKLKRLELKRDKEEISSRKKRKSGECEHRYGVLAISGRIEYLQCVVCGKKRHRKANGSVVGDGSRLLEKGLP